MGSSTPPRNGDALARARDRDGRRALVAAFPLIAENPYQRLLYEALEQRGFALEPTAHFRLRWLWRERRRVDVLHFHWPRDHYRWWRRPESLRPFLSWLKLPLYATRLAAARALGYRIAWTIHEVYPHERRGSRLDRLAGRLLARASHVLIAHDRGTAELAARELGPAASHVVVIPHGSYVGVYPKNRTRAEVRAGLGLGERTFVFLAFGHLRAYKTLDLLLEAFSAAALPDAALVVAGMPIDEPTEAAARAAAEADGRIRLSLGFVPDEQVADLFGACDAAVLPRSDGGTSGALVLALSQGVPVVAAAMRDYAELTGGDDAAWLFRPGDVDSLRQALEAAAGDRDAVQRKGAAAFGRARELAWDAIAERTAAELRVAPDGSLPVRITEASS